MAAASDTRSGLTSDRRKWIGIMHIPCRLQDEFVGFAPRACKGIKTQLSITVYLRPLVTVLAGISTQTVLIREGDDMGAIVLWDNLLYSTGAKKFITIYVMDKEA